VERPRGVKQYIPAMVVNNSLVVVAVCDELVSELKFPDTRENSGNFRKISHLLLFFALKSAVIARAYTINSLLKVTRNSLQQAGNYNARTGNFSQQTGFTHRLYLADISVNELG
jgi:hypothetical protein